MSRGLISADLFRARGDEWMTRRQQERDYFGDDTVSENPDIDMYTKATKTSRYSGLVVVKARPEVNSRSVSQCRRSSLMLNLNKKMR